MKALVFPIPEELSGANMFTLVNELLIQKANFFVLNDNLYVLNDKQNKGLQSLLEHIEGDYTCSSQEDFELLIDIKKVESVFKA